MKVTDRVTKRGRVLRVKVGCHVASPIGSREMITVPICVSIEMVLVGKRRSSAALGKSAVKISGDGAGMFSAEMVFSTAARSAASSAQIADVARIARHRTVFTPS